MNVLLFTANELTGDRLVVRDHRAQHLREVLKVRTGQSIHIGQINGQMGQGVVSETTDGHVALLVRLGQNPPQPAPLTLILALPRPKVLARLIETTTAMGIKRLALCNSARVEKYYWHAHQLGDREIQRHVLRGLEQSRDTRLPEITLHRLFRPFVEDEVPSLIQERECWVAHPHGAEVLPRTLHSPSVLAIGPEGGWLDFEVDLFQARGFRVGNGGPRLLHCETAVPALLGRLLP